VTALEGSAAGEKPVPFPQIAITFSPAWWLTHYGREPEAVERQSLLYERFGDVGLGEEHPAPPEPCVGGEYGDRFMAALWGCEIVHQPGCAPAAKVLPDARARMADLDVPDLATSPVAQRALADARALKERHGHCRAAVNFGGPLNNAVSVFGEEILRACAAEPDLARRVLQQMGAAILAVHDEIVCPLNGVEVSASREAGWGIGNCPVCMISPAMYREVVLPADLWLVGQFHGGFHLHHCGVFDAYAEVYRPLSPASLDLGPGSDLRVARTAYPAAALSTYIEVGALARMNRDAVDAAVRRLVEHAGPAELFTAITVAEAGPEVADETVRHLMTARERLS